MRRILPLALFLLLACLPAETPRPPVVAMCQPTETQIRNIVELYERDLIPLPRIELVGVYLEDEETDYQPARDYVKANDLSWVRFRVIRGRVAAADIYGENAWTPQFRELLAEIDGLVMTGGEDMPPFLYEAPVSLLTTPLTPRRSAYEVSLLSHLLGGRQHASLKPLLADRPRFPLLAICLGMQSLNVACGGTLQQDIPGETYGLKTAEEVLALPVAAIHSSVYAKMANPGADQLPPAFHPVRLEPGSPFTEEMGMKSGDRPWVLSSHHQGVARLAPGLRVTARSLDGRIIEGLRHERFANVLGVQFHPESHRLYVKDLFYRETPAAPATLNLRAMLESRPPSTEFHRRLWRWFADRLQEEAARRGGGQRSPG